MQKADSRVNTKDPTGAVKLVRPGGRVSNPATEQVVLLDRTDRVLRIVQSVLPVGGVKYVVPSGKLERAIDFDGSVLTVGIEETGEAVSLYPRLRAIGLATDPSAAESGRTLASILHDHLDAQIPRLRTMIDTVFRDFIGLRASASLLDGIASHLSDGADGISGELRKRVGLEVEWVLEPEPTVAAWVQKLQALIADNTTQSFNQESRTAQFNLTYSARIIAVLPSRLHLVQRRARAGLPPAEELSRILKRVFVILNPAFGVFGDGSQIWRHPSFHPLLGAAFEQVVAPKIADEFGYEIVFGDFKRERTPAELDVLQLLENRDRLVRDFESAERFYIGVQEKEREAIVENDYDMEATYVVKVQNATEQARAKMEEARSRMEAASRGGATLLGGEDSHRALQLLKVFHDRLHLGHPELLKIEDDSSRPEEPPVE